jgi:hypothetical protein
MVIGKVKKRKQYKKFAPYGVKIYFCLTFVKKIC